MQSNKKYQRMTFHHVGIPTNSYLPDDTHNPQLKMHATGYFETPYAMEWMNFDEDSSLPEVIKTQPHIGYVVESVEDAIQGRNVVLSPRSPAPGVIVAFVLEGRDLIEFLQFDKPEDEVWPHPNKFMLETLGKKA
ncbi:MULTISPECIES: hypothetical protein [Vibrio]|uniref:hypothetical protein n=1 Tax=Vibrio TaxID=662 RepID=UPI00148E3DF7|nr:MULTISPECIES: hypothetical protein [Vibrio]NOI26867.1 hypothetical protein [Vibrio mediterranei]